MSNQWSCLCICSVTLARLGSRSRTSRAEAFMIDCKRLNFLSCYPYNCSKTIKPLWQFLNRFHIMLLQTSGMHCQIIFRPVLLFLLLEELSNVIYSCLLTLIVVQNLVRSNQLNVSHFVIQRQLYCHLTTRKYHAAQLKTFHMSEYDQSKWFISHKRRRGHKGP